MCKLMMRMFLEKWAEHLCKGGRGGGERVGGSLHEDERKMFILQNTMQTVKRCCN